MWSVRVHWGPEEQIGTHVLVVHMHFEQFIVDIAWLCGAVRQICCSKSENTRTANVNDCYQQMKSVKDVNARETGILVTEAEENDMAGAKKDIAKENIPCDAVFEES